MRAKENFLRRRKRVRFALKKVAQRPFRLTVYRSSLHIYAQLIDDTKGHTCVSASSLEKELSASLSGLKNVEKASVVGRILAERAREKGIVDVFFDRGGYLYHGRVKALAESARTAGLNF